MIRHTIVTRGGEPARGRLRTRRVTTSGYTMTVGAAAGLLSCTENDVRRLMGLRELRFVEIGLPCSGSPPRVLRVDVDRLLVRRAGHPVRLAVGR